MPSCNAVVFTKPGHAELRLVEVQNPGPGEVLVQAACTAVSVGTEMRVLGGIQEPGQEFPVVPGYASAGVVVEADEAFSHLVGKRVLGGGTRRCSVRPLWGGHCRLSVVGGSEVIPLPDSVSDADGAMARLAAISWRGVDLSQAKPGETVLVVGLGVIGQLSARLFACAGCQVAAVDLAEGRVAAARADGVDASVIGSIAEAKQFFANGPDILVDATGSEKVLPQAIDLCRFDPWDDLDHKPTRYIIQGSYPGDFSVPYQEAFLRQIIFMLPRDCQPKDKRKSIDLMASGQLKMEGIKTMFPVAEATAVYDRLYARDPSLIAPVFVWP